VDSKSNKNEKELIGTWGLNGIWDIFEKKNNAKAEFSFYKEGAFSYTEIFTNNVTRTETGIWAINLDTLKVTFFPGIIIGKVNYKNNMYQKKQKEKTEVNRVMIYGYKIEQDKLYLIFKNSTIELKKI